MRQTNRVPRFMEVVRMSCNMVDYFFSKNQWRLPFAFFQLFSLLPTDFLLASVTSTRLDAVLLSIEK